VESFTHYAMPLPVREDTLRYCNFVEFIGRDILWSIKRDRNSSYCRLGEIWDATPKAYYTIQFPHLFKNCPPVVPPLKKEGARAKNQ